jgi:hypothetical protein
MVREELGKARQALEASLARAGPEVGTHLIA